MKAKSDNLIGRNKSEDIGERRLKKIAGQSQTIQTKQDFSK